MEQQFAKTAEQISAFQKLWTESASRMFQAAFTATPNSPPPEFLRQIRSGIFSALAQSWDEFMRSPQFLESMRQWMDNAISFRKMTNEFMARLRNELQAPSREDTDTVMLNIRHMEKRLLDRIDDLSREVNSFKQELAARPLSPSAPSGARRTTNKPRRQRSKA
jgi:hypothetical protein